MNAGLLALLLSVPASAGSAGAEALDFLQLDGGARPVALGGAYTALAADANAALYNPAGYALVPRHEATLMHNEYVEGLRQHYVGLALRQGLGFHLNYLTYGEIKRTTLAQPDGTGESFGARDLAAGVGYGRAFGPLALGAAAKYVSQSIDDVDARGWAADFGALYKAAPGVTIGASLLNAGPEIGYQHAKEKLPSTARAGAAWSGEVSGGNRLTAALDVTKVRSDKPRLGLGSELVLLKSLALRAGWTTRQDAGIGLTAGLGWNTPAYGVDYAFAPLGDAGMAHRISLTLRWGEERVAGGRRSSRWYSTAGL